MASSPLVRTSFPTQQNEPILVEESSREKRGEIANGAKILLKKDFVCVNDLNPYRNHWVLLGTFSLSPSFLFL
jgi:hypothetical protein